MSVRAEELKPAPCSIESEKELLGQLFYSPELVKQIKDRLDPDDFYSDAHRAIFQKIISGCALDETVLHDELRHLKDVAGNELVSLHYLLSLTDGRVRIDSVDSYIDILQKKKMHRDALALAEKLKDIAHGNWEQLRRGIEGVSQDVARFTENSRFVGGERVDDSLKQGQEYFRQRCVLQENKKDRLAVPGWGLFNTLIGGGFKHGRNYVIASRPGSGKTSFIVHLAVAFAKQGKPGLMIQIENPEFDIWDKIVANVCQMNSLTISDHPETMTEDQHNRVRDAVEEYAPYIHIVHSNTLNIDEICRKIYAYKKQCRIEWFMVDYIQRIQGDRRRNELENITRHVTILDEMAEKMDLVEIGISMANREAEGAKIGMRNMKGSGEIEQAADVIIALQTSEEMMDQELEEITVDIIKNRHGAKGPVKMKFKKSFSHFSENAL